MRLCIDCKFHEFRPVDSGHICLRENRISPVDGRKITIFCEEERRSEDVPRCALPGIFFEHKDYLS